MNENKHISEEGLDGLLKAHALNYSSDEMDVMMGQVVMNADYDVRMNKNKEKELLNKLDGKGRPPWFTLIILLGLAVTGVFFFFIRNDKLTEDILPEQHVQFIASSKKNVEDGAVYVMDDSSLTTLFNGPIEEADNLLSIDSGNPSVEPNWAKEKKLEQLTEVIILTPNEILYYLDLKKDMVARILSEDEKIYTFVRAGELSYKGENRGIDAFIFRNFSITNMEYKAYLADLIHSNKQIELKRALVKSEVWRNFGSNNLANAYFKDKSFDGYPVVNISAKAAVSYCIWLEINCNTQLKLDNPKAKSIRIRLPKDFEWLYATRVGVAHTASCGGYQTIYDESEGMVNRAFLRRMAKIQERDKKKQKVFDEYLQINRYGMSEQEVQKIFGVIDLNDDGVYPDQLKEISRLAHVSELIEDEKGQQLVFGACWESKAQYLTMLTAYKKAQASPYIGFRFVIETEDTGTFKDPFW